MDLKAQDGWWVLQKDHRNWQKSTHKLGTSKPKALPYPSNGHTDFFYFSIFIRNSDDFFSNVKPRRMRNPSLNINLIKTKEKKKAPKAIKTSWHYYFDTFELHIEIQSSWMRLRGMLLQALMVDVQNDE